MPRDTARNTSPTVLVCEDDPTYLTILGKKLEQMGCRVLLRVNGDEGLQIVRSQHLDLILTDNTMPVMSGLELLQLLGRERPDLPVILMTAAGSEEFAAEVLNLGAKRYLIKPVNLKVMEQAIYEVLDQQEQQREQKENLAALQLVEELSQHITSNLAIREVLDKITSSLDSAFEAAFTGIWLSPELTVTTRFQPLRAVATDSEIHPQADGHERRFTLCCWAGTASLSENLATISPRDSTLLGDILSSKKAVLYPSQLHPSNQTNHQIDDEARAGWLERLGQEGFCGFPLFDSPECCGIFAVFVPRERVAHVARVLKSLSHLISVALHDARLFLQAERELAEGKQIEAELNKQRIFYARDLRSIYNQERGRREQLRRSFLDTVRAMANAIEARDLYTAGHTRRVTRYGLAMATYLGWEEERLHIVEMGGLLHDIGKIGVPDAVLTKPGRLTEEEFSQIQRHPSIGATIVAGIEFLVPAVPYILYHHERYDGKGYPEGLAGEAIPIEGRLLAVADTFDAMTSTRPYRPGLAVSVALQEIERNAATQFDPEMVKVFLAARGAGSIRTDEEIRAALPEITLETTSG